MTQTELEHVPEVKNVTNHLLICELEEIINSVIESLFCEEWESELEHSYPRRAMLGVLSLEQ